MGTAENRAYYARSRLRHPTDLTEAEWALISRLIPPSKRGGNKRTVEMREVVNSLMYVLGTGCRWRAVPKDLAPRSTVYGYFGVVQNRVTREAGLVLSGGMMASCRFQVLWAYGSECWRGGEAARG